MWGIPFDEDAYWERRREEWENPRRWRDENWEPEPERECLYLDEEMDEIEQEYNCTMKELPEGDLMDIVERMTDQRDHELLSAVWQERYFCIEYTYRAA